MKWIDGLRTWRRERNLKSPSGVFREMILEELNEYTVAKHAFNEHDTVDAIVDIIVLAVNELELEGYNTDLAMKQVVKHISSRKQDPIQHKEWLANGQSGKWRKDPNQDPSTIYTADYSTCRMKIL